MQPISSKPSFSKKKNTACFILAILLLLSTSLGSFFVFKHLGIQDEIAKSLVAVIVYPVLGLIVWLGGLNLIGLNTREKRILGVLICLGFFVKPVVTLGFQQLGISLKTASIIGVGVWLVVMLAIAIGVYPKIQNQ